jgi:DNA-binding response OmpR family regulator
MIIDDEETFLKLVKNILEPEGFEVSTAYEGREGIEKMRKNLPDLLLLDINLPEVDGFQICQQIRKDPQLRELPIIMLTIRDKPEDEIRGLNIGSDDYLSKPFHPEDLITRINMVLRRVSR